LWKSKDKTRALRTTTLLVSGIQTATVTTVLCLQRLALMTATVIVVNPQNCITLM